MCYATQLLVQQLPDILSGLLTDVDPAQDKLGSELNSYVFKGIPHFSRPNLTSSQLDKQPRMPEVEQHRQGPVQQVPWLHQQLQRLQGNQELKLSNSNMRLNDSAQRGIRRESENEKEKATCSRSLIENY